MKLHRCRDAKGPLPYEDRGREWGGEGITGITTNKLGRGKDFP